MTARRSAGWVSNSVLRRATDDDKGPTTPLPEVIAPPTPPRCAAHAALRKKMAESIVNFEARRDAQGHLASTSFPPATAAVATK
jgi:hypothetical protein